MSQATYGRRVRVETLAMFLALTVGCETAGDRTVTREIRSPDGQYKAVEFTDMGGGAAGWCWHAVRVLPQAVPFNPLETRSTEIPRRVFSVSCSSDLALSWRANDNLEISYTLGSGGVNVWQRPSSEDVPVSLSYIVRRGPK